MKEKEQFGLFVGRFSPWHNMHQWNVDKIKQDELTPIVFVGSSQEFKTSKNPWHVQDRMNIIQLVNPGMKVYALQDKSCWDEWHDQLIKCIKLVVSDNLSNVTIYVHNKPEDRLDFTFRGIEYKNEFYSKMYEIDGMSVKNIPYSGVEVHATDIRNDLELNKQHLDKKVYDYLKELK